MDNTSQPSWHLQNWQRPERRYYRCTLQQNLFHDWVLLRQWGTVQNHRGGSVEIACCSYEDGVQQLDAIAKRRMQRGYQRIRLDTLHLMRLTAEKSC